ncbi:MAG: enoyl-CoA hydratase/isomerase family protein [Deltaproteobacteria bacterium]|nr:MAG: enoyl-CoA hydratase/isomerase family protein [Deltaproteobacteria bacterium]
MTDALLVEKRAGALWCTINRPKRRNALSAEVVERLLEALGSCKAEDGTRAIVITGAGDRAFCAGGDLSDSLSIKPENVARGYADLLGAMVEAEVPIIGRINGDCLGGGIGLVCCCDLAVAVDTARFSTPEVKLGLFPMIIAPLMERFVGPRLTREMIYAARSITAQEAERAGLVNIAVERNLLDTTVESWIARISEASAHAIAAGRRELERARWLAPWENAENLSRAFGRLAEGEDARSRIAAFLARKQKA